MTATAGPALVFDSAEQGGLVLAQLAGVINEDNSLNERLTAVRGRGVLIDLANVERINSCGVRDWIRFAQRLEAAGNALYLLRCSPVVVAQLNMVRNFCGEKGHVVSFQAPYFCPNCDEERTETFPSTKVAAGTDPEAICPTCKGPMEFDDLPDLYFAFAKIHGCKEVPPEVQSAMDSFRNGLPKSAAPVAASPAPAAPRPPSAAPPSPARASGLVPAPAPAAAVPPPMPSQRQSNPALSARPAVPVAAPTPVAAAPAPAPAPAAMAPPTPMAAARPISNPALRPPPSAVAVSAVPAAAVPANAGAPASAAAAAAARISGPKPVRPLMGGSPFPTRPSGAKPALVPAPGVPDPTKK